jgi:hypothetical protein
MKVWTVVSQEVRGLKQGHTISPGLALAAESTSDSSMISVAAGAVTSDMVSVAAGTAVSDAVSVKGEDVCSMPAI